MSTTANAPKKPPRKIVMRVSDDVPRSQRVTTTVLPPTAVVTPPPPPPTVVEEEPAQPPVVEQEEQEQEQEAPKSRYTLADELFGDDDDDESPIFSACKTGTFPEFVGEFFADKCMPWAMASESKLLAMIKGAYRHVCSNTRSTVTQRLQDNLVFENVAATCAEMRDVIIKRDKDDFGLVSVGDIAELYNLHFADCVTAVTLFVDTTSKSVVRNFFQSVMRVIFTVACIYRLVEDAVTEEDGSTREAAKLVSSSFEDACKIEQNNESGVASGLDDGKLLAAVAATVPDEAQRADLYNHTRLTGSPRNSTGVKEFNEFATSMFGFCLLSMGCGAGPACWNVPSVAVTAACMAMTPQMSKCPSPTTLHATALDFLRDRGFAPKGVVLPKTPDFAQFWKLHSADVRVLNNPFVLKFGQSEVSLRDDVKRIASDNDAKHSGRDRKRARGAATDTDTAPSEKAALGCTKIARSLSRLREILTPEGCKEVMVDFMKRALVVDDPKTRAEVFALSDILFLRRHSLRSTKKQRHQLPQPQDSLQLEHPTEEEEELTRNADGSSEGEEDEEEEE